MKFLKDTSMHSLEFSIYLTLTFIVSVYGCTDADTWIHKTFLDNDADRVFMQWKPENESIRIKVTGKTKGWVGIGFSPNGDMIGSDIALAWVKDGKGYLQDRHAYENHQPPIDKKQDLELLSAYENETHTSFCFRRNLITCDEEDFPITMDTMRIIWAMNPEDPTDSENASSAIYHGPKDRGYLSQYMLSDLYLKPSMPSDDIKTWKVQVHNVSISNNETTFYWCQFFKPPQLTKKHHVIGYTPQIQKENQGIIHHFSLFECHGENINQQIESIPNWDEGFPCFSPNAPIASLSCNKHAIEWTRGGKEEFFPPNVGFPLNTNIYYMINAHYNNPSLLQDLYDSSSHLIYYTSKLRQYDGSILQLGVVMHQPFQLIPPRQEDWLTVGHCAPECLQKTFPTNKFKVFGGLLHGHMTTHKIVIRHFRGSKELPPIAENDNVDYLYQENIFFKEVEVYTTDTITVECHVRTSNRTNMTMGGPAVDNEMCLIFMFYYPKSNLSSCYSHLSLNDIEQLTEVKEVWPQKSNGDELIIKEPSNLRNVTLRDYLQQIQFNQSQINTLQQMELKSDKTAICATDDLNKKPKDVTVVNYPKNIIPYVKQDPCTAKTDE